MAKPREVDGMTFVAAPLVGVLLGTGQGVARVYEARRLAAGPDTRSLGRKVWDGGWLILFWAGRMAILCYCMVLIFG